MTALRLEPIDRTGSVASGTAALPEMARNACEHTALWYERVGFNPPWCGYVAFDGNDCVGVCAFKTAPQNGSVEIAYGTIEAHQGKGIATRMARQLTALARALHPGIIVTAQTLPQPNASTRVLTKAGFVKTRELIHPEDGLVWEWRATEEPHPIS